MNGRPAYRDFLFHREGRYIRSGGQYYVIARNKKKTALKLAFWLGIFLPAICVCTWLTFAGSIWPAWVGDLYLVFIPASVFLPGLSYRRARFVPVQAYTEAWYKTAALEYSAVFRVISIVMFALLTLLYAPGSFTVSAVRSQLSGSAGVVSASFSGSGSTFYSSENDIDEATQVFAAGLLDDGVCVNIDVTQTPCTALLTLDGQPVPEKYQPSKELSAFFSLHDYFEQSTYFHVSGHRLHDGSVLALTCGGLRREWVFHCSS